MHQKFETFELKIWTRVLYSLMFESHKRYACYMDTNNLVEKPHHEVEVALGACS